MIINQGMDTMRNLISFLFGLIILITSFKDLSAQQSLIRINCGGFAVTYDSITFSADEYYTGTFAYRNNNLDVKNTTYDELYRSERGPDSAMAKFWYHIPVINGTYNVYMHFAEIYWGVLDTGGVGTRVFNVLAEDTPVFENFDIAAEVGVGSALVKSFEITVTDDTLDLEFAPLQNRGKISALEIIPPGAEPLEVKRFDPVSKQYSLLQNYPNPFNPETQIEFSIPSFEYVTLKIFDLEGELTDILIDQNLEAGRYNITWDASFRSSGIYFYRLQTKHYSRTGKMILLR